MVDISSRLSRIRGSITISAAGSQSVQKEALEDIFIMSIAVTQQYRSILIDYPASPPVISMTSTGINFYYQNNSQDFRLITTNFFGVF
ncbi:MAG: hypothetical protein LBE22_07555 [Azoarcus sp.]|nr:hypothetical protein [Azoarcus sp.]